MWLAKVYALCAQKEIDAAVDVLFDSINQMFLTQDWCQCDAMLQSLDVNRLDTHLLVAVLAVTQAATQHLPSRPDLVCRITERLRELAPDRADHLLHNLV